MLSAITLLGTACTHELNLLKVLMMTMYIIHLPKRKSRCLLTTLCCDNKQSTDDYVNPNAQSSSRNNNTQSNNIIITVAGII